MTVYLVAFLVSAAAEPWEALEYGHVVTPLKENVLSMLVSDAARGAVLSVDPEKKELWSWSSLNPTWIRRAMPDVGMKRPIERTVVGIAHDPSDGSGILFSGFGHMATAQGQSDFADTWRFKYEPDEAQSDWVFERLMPSTSPSARLGHAMAFFRSSSGIGKVLLFGGLSQQLGGGNPVVLADTWIWDGSNWALGPPGGTVPSGRRSHALAVHPEANDPNGGVVYLYGGSAESVLYQDLWTWKEQTSWTQVSATSAPGPRHRHALRYHRGRQRIILYGGATTSNGAATKDTWELDAAQVQWQKTSPGPAAPLPTQLADLPGTPHLAAIDAEGLWAYGESGSAWRLVRGHPGGANIAGVTENGATGAVVTYTQYGLWEWDGGRRKWIERPSTGPIPAARTHSAMTLMSARGTVLLSGGVQAGACVSDVWEWDPASGEWASIPPGPEKRRNHAMADFPSHGRVVVFGGFDTSRPNCVSNQAADTTIYGDTWEWDGDTWLRFDVAPAPAARSGARMSFDGRRVVLLGGTAYAQGADGNLSPTAVADTWSWDGDAWQEHPQEQAPVVGLGMTYHPEADRVILSPRTWAWNGETLRWGTSFEGSVQPPWKGAAPASAYSARDGYLIFYTGESTWGYTPNLAPVIDADSPTVEEGTRLTLAVGASDAEGDAITLTISHLPVGASFDPIRSVIDWPIGCRDAGEYEVEATASDGENNTIKRILITVVPANCPPILHLPESLSGRVGESLEFLASADDPDGDVVSIGDLEMPEGAAFDGGAFRWTPSAAQVGRSVIALQVDDGTTQIRGETAAFIFAADPTGGDEDSPQLILTLLSPAGDSPRLGPGERAHFEAMATHSGRLALDIESGTGTERREVLDLAAMELSAFDIASEDLPVGRITIRGALQSIRGSAESESWTLGVVRNADDPIPEPEPARSAASAPGGCGCHGADSAPWLTPLLLAVCLRMRRFAAREM